MKRPDKVILKGYPFAVVVDLKKYDDLKKRCAKILKASKESKK